MKKQLTTDNIMLFVTFVLGLLYFYYSHLSDGFYQHDEAAHFISMKRFWHDPFSVLGNWNKPGYKLLYALPALGGRTVVLLVNCFVAAFSCFLAYKVAKTLKSQFAILAFCLLALQPMWVQLSFRNYSEIITAFLLILSLHFHHKNKLLLSTFIISYISIIRQEFYIILAIYGLYLIYKKEWKAILSGVIPQIIITVWSYFGTGDILYIINNVINTSEKYASAYPRQGFDHYPKMSVIIFGATGLTLAIHYIATKIFNIKKIHLTIVIPALLFLLLHSLFNHKTLNFGPASGGNLRYMTVISPLIALMGALSIDGLKQLKNRFNVFIIVIPFIIIVWLYMSYQVSGVSFSDEHNWNHLIFTIIAAIPLLLPIKHISKKIIMGILIVIAFANLISVIKPIKQNYEEEIVEQTAIWYKNLVRTNKKVTTDNRVFASHALFYYYNNKSEKDFKKEAFKIKQPAIDTAEPGSLIFWDSHYSYRPKLKKNSVPLEYFKKRPNEYALIKRFSETNKSFEIDVFFKYRHKNPTYEKALELFEKGQIKESQHLFEQVIQKDPKNYAALYFYGLTKQRENNINAAMQYYNKALALNQQFEYPLFQRARIYHALGKNKNALNDLNKYIQLNKRNYQAFFLAGKIFYQQNKLKQANNSIVNALRLNSNYANGYFYLGLIQLKNKQKKNACKYFNQAKQLGHEKAEKAVKMYCK